MLTCRDAHALIVRTIDDASLPAAARLTLREHLSTCAACREEYDTQHAVRRLLTLHVEEQPPAGFDTRLRARLAEVPRHRPRPALRRWAIRLLPIAATLALIVTDTHLRDVASPAPLPLVTPAPAPVAHRDIPLTPPRRRQSPRLATEADVFLHASSEPASAPTPTPAPAARAAAAPAEAAIAPASTHSDGLADLLKLTETQRRQIAEITDSRRQTLQDILDSARKRVEMERHQTDAAIERVLTPEQRKQYRAAAATRERNASQGWALLPPAPAIPSPTAAPPPPPLLPDRAGPPFEP